MKINNNRTNQWRKKFNRELYGEMRSQKLHVMPDNTIAELYNVKSKDTTISNATSNELVSRMKNTTGSL